MGAHTVGQFVQSSQMFKYWWSRGEHSYFNNDYYKTMTATQDYIIRSPDKVRTITKSTKDHVLPQHLLFLYYFNQLRPDKEGSVVHQAHWMQFSKAVLMQTAFFLIRAAAISPVCAQCKQELLMSYHFELAVWCKWEQS